MWNDLQFAFRLLKRSPGFVAVAILSLMLGIGANTAIFSLLCQVVFQPLPIPDPQSLVSLQDDDFKIGYTRTDSAGRVFSYPMYKALRDRNQVSSGLIATAGFMTDFSHRGRAVSAAADVVTGNYFSVLGVKPALGRLLLPSDDSRNTQQDVVVLGYAFWSKFGQDPHIINQRVLVNNHPMLVVGVAPPNFRGLLSGTDPGFYLPESAIGLIDKIFANDDQADTHWLDLFGRLKPGVSQAQASAQLTPLMRSIFQEELPQFKDLTADQRKRFGEKTMTVQSAAQGFNQLKLRWQAPLTILMAMVGLVLLMACVNVANLLIARAAGREREFAIRLAVGATKFQIFRQLLIESLLLSLTGGLIGLFMSEVFSKGLLSLISTDAFDGWLSPKLDWRLLGFSIALSVVTGVLFGMATALQAVKPELADTLREKTSGISASSTKGRFRQFLVAAQVCLSLILLIGAGLFTGSLLNTLRVQPGFQPDHVVTFSIDLSWPVIPLHAAMLCIVIWKTGSGHCQGLSR